MKFIHTADLHLGKSIYGLSMLENQDQKDWIEKFLILCKNEKPDAVMIAGDVYDRSTPSGEAVQLLDHMITELSEMNIAVLIIAGNHDSGQRLSFASTMLAKENIFIAGTVQKEMMHVTLQDEYGPVTFWLMPYLFPEEVSVLLQDESIHTYGDAAKKLLAVQKINFQERNVLIAHQNVVANGREGLRGGSESMVGGVGEIEYTVFDGFDYVALGHIHSAYPVGRESIRYCGTPLCYHFEETKQPEKGPLLIELKAKGVEPSIRLEEIKPLHKMRALKGTYQYIHDLLKNDPGRNEYISITLTDQRIKPAVAAEFRDLLQSRGSVLMELVSEYTEYGTLKTSGRTHTSEKPIEDLFAEMFAQRNNDLPPEDDAYALMKYVGQIVREGRLNEPVTEHDTERILAFAEKLKGEN